MDAMSQCRWPLLIVAAVLTLPVGPAAVAEAAPDGGRALLGRYCYDCHGPEKQKADLRLDTLSETPGNRSELEHWVEIADAIKLGDMPPADADRQPDEAATARLIEWVTEVVESGAATLEPRERRALRRLTKAEYTTALQQLTGLPIEFGSLVPDDTLAEGGFKNDAEVLYASSMHAEAWLEAARRVAGLLLDDPTPPQPDPRVDFDITMRFDAVAEQVSRAKALGYAEGSKLLPRAHHGVKIYDDGQFRFGRLSKEEQRLPVTGRWRIDLLANVEHKKGKPAHAITRFEDGKWVVPHGRWSRKQGAQRSDVLLPPWGQFSLARVGYATEGWARVVVRAGSVIPEGAEAPQMRLALGLPYEFVKDVREIDTVVVNNPATAMRDYTFVFRLEAMGLTSQAKYRADPTPVHLITADKAPGSRRVDSTEPAVIEIYNPHELPKRGHPLNPTHMWPVAYDDALGRILVEEVRIQWPWHPPTDPAIEAGLVVPAAGDPQQEVAELRTALVPFVSRAWRRAPKPEEMTVLLAGYLAAREEGIPPRQAMAEFVVAVLCSPHFLYIDQGTEGDGKHLHGRAIANRLAFWLSGGAPDEQLAALARDGKLSDGATRRAQAERLIDGPHLERFLHRFVDQWLLVGLEDVAVDDARFRDFEEFHRDLLRAEAEAFVMHVLRENRPIDELLSADYRLLNNELADYYGIAGVWHHDFRPVALPEDQPRAGLLALGGPMLATGDGLESNPFARGLWVLDRILGTPPPPPPPAVPQIDRTDPEVARLTLQEQLARHRTSPVCAACHDRLDPWGLAMEGFNASGRPRTHYRKPDHKASHPVDASGTLADGTTLDGVAGVRDAILGARRDLFVRNLARTVFRYAVARELEAGDLLVVDRIAARLAESNPDTGLRDLVLALVADPAFTLP